MRGWGPAKGCPHASPRATKPGRWRSFAATHQRKRWQVSAHRQGRSAQPIPPFPPWDARLESAPLATPSGHGRRSQHRHRDAEGSAHRHPRARHPDVETIPQGFQILWFYSWFYSAMWKRHVSHFSTINVSLLEGESDHLKQFARHLRKILRVHCHAEAPREFDCRRKRNYARWRSTPFSIRVEIAASSSSVSMHWRDTSKSRHTSLKSCRRLPWLLMRQSRSASGLEPK